jgi:hypothetical protein
MKIRLFLMVFCVLLCVGELSAQKRDWIEVPLSSLGYSSASIVGPWYIDSSSIRRLPDGNVTYWGKGSGVIFQTEVNCVAKEQRTLRRIELSRTDSYGNEISAESDSITESQMEWRPATPTSISDIINGIACTSAKNIVSRSDKPVAKKKVVKGTRKRKQ